MPTLVIGYNVEWTGDQSTTRSFLDQVRARHTQLDAPCTLFLRAEVVERHHEPLEQLVDDPRFDLQATIEGPLKTVCQRAEGETSLWPGADLDVIGRQVSRACRAVKDITDESPVGISDSMGAYRGLQDRPDILRILDGHGILFTRTHARNMDDWQPVDFSVEPYWYTFQGFPHMLEFPSQGWQTSIIRKLYEWEDVSGYTGFLKMDVEEAALREGLVWSHWVQDWSAIREDADLTIIRELVDHARQHGIEISTQKQAYDMLKAKEHPE